MRVPCGGALSVLSGRLECRDLVPTGREHTGAWLGVAGLALAGGAALLLFWVLFLSGTAGSSARNTRIAQRPGEQQPTASRHLPDDLGKELIHAFSLSLFAAAIGMLALACVAAILLPPLDSDYRPGSFAEWVFYGVFVVPSATVLGAKAIGMTVRGYEAVWRFISRDLSRPVFHRGDPPPR